MSRNNVELQKKILYHTIQRKSIIKIILKNIKLTKLNKLIN